MRYYFKLVNIGYESTPIYKYTDLAPTAFGRVERYNCFNAKGQLSIPIEQEIIDMMIYCGEHEKGRKKYILLNSDEWMWEIIK